MEPPPLSPGCLPPKGSSASSRRESTTQDHHPIRGRQTPVQRDGAHLQSTRSQSGRVEDHCQQEAEVLIGQFKTIFSDSFLSPFTNNLAYSLSQIST